MGGKIIFFEKIFLGNNIMEVILQVNFSSNFKSKKSLKNISFCSVMIVFLLSLLKQKIIINTPILFI